LPTIEVGSGNRLPVDGVSITILRLIVSSADQVVFVGSPVACFGKATATRVWDLRQVEVVGIDRRDIAVQHVEEVLDNAPPPPRIGLLKPPTEAGDRPSEKVVALSQAEDRVPQRRDADDRSVRSGVVSDKVEDVAPRGALIRNGPEVARVAPHILQPEAGDLVAGVRRHQFERRPDGVVHRAALTQRTRKALSQFRSVSKQASDAALLHRANEGARAGFAELRLTGKCERLP